MQSGRFRRSVAATDGPNGIVGQGLRRIANLEARQEEEAEAFLTFVVL